MKMKLRFFVLSLLLLPILLHCQSKPSLETVLGVDYAYRTLSERSSNETLNDSLLNFIIDGANDREEGNIFFTDYYK